MAIQWINSFEDLGSAQSAGSSGSLTDIIGWSNVGTADASFGLSVTDTTSNRNDTYGSPTKNGLAGAIQNRSQASGYALYRTYQKTVTDNSKLVVCGGCRLADPIMLKQTAILSFGGANKLSFGLNGKFAAIYINDTLAATSTVNVVTGAPYFFVTMFQNKVADRIYLLINGAAAADVQLPASHTTNAVILDLGRAVSGYNVAFTEIVTYDSVDPIGPLMVHEFFKTTTAINQFTGSTAIPNNRPFSAASFMNSETLGAEDRWSYTNILPTGVEIGSIKAVIQKAVAASGGVTGGSLNLRMRVASSGATNYDTSVSASLVSTTPVLVQKIWETNPATTAAWTRSEVQGIHTGYVVAT